MSGMSICLSTAMGGVPPAHAELVFLTMNFQVLNGVLRAVLLKWKSQQDLAPSEAPLTLFPKLLSRSFGNSS